MNRLDLKRLQIHEILQVQTLSWPLLDLKAVDCMTRDVLCISTKNTVWEILELYETHHFRHVPVIDENRKLVGIVSDRDVLRTYGEDTPLDSGRLVKITADQVMSSDLVVIESSSSVVAALRAMLLNGFNSLPVVTEGRLVGILTSTDLYAVLEYLLDPYTVARISLPEVVSREADGPPPNESWNRQRPRSART